VESQFAQYAQRQAEIAAELMRLSGTSREEIQHHVTHSLYSLRDLLDYYKAAGHWPCE